MTILVNTLVFLLGMCLCVQLIAALYGILDQWYTITTTYPVVIRRIVIWSLIPLAIAWFLGEVPRSALIWGFVTYVALYIGIFGGYQWLFRRNLRLLGIRQPYVKGIKDSRVQRVK